MIDEQQLAKYRTLKQQVLPFDFWDEERDDERKKEEAIKTEIEQRTQALIYYQEPKTDNQRLMNLQWELKHGCPGALEQMYELLVAIGKRLIGAIGKNNPHVRRLNAEERDIKARDAANYIIEQFITRRDFFITKNFPGYLFLRIQHELFYMTKADEIVDFVDLAAFFKEGTEDE